MKACCSKKLLYGNSGLPRVFDWYLNGMPGTQYEAVGKMGIRCAFEACCVRTFDQITESLQLQILKKVFLQNVHFSFEND